MRLTSLAAVLFTAQLAAPFAAAATIDTSFATTGQARDLLDLGTSQADLIADVALASSTGSLYTVGRVEHVGSYGPTFGVMFKRLSNGEKDTTFFNGNSPSSRVLIPAERSGGSSALNAVAFDASYRGAVMLAGFNDLSNGQRCGVVYKVLDRVADRGSFDGSFGTGGRYAYCSAHGADITFNDIKVLSDGRVLVAGTGAKTSGEKFPFLLRLTAAGGLDTTFAATSPSPGVLALEIRSGKDDTGLRIAIGAQGYYVAGNSTYAPSSDPWLFGADIDLWVARVLTSGVLDTSFNGAGKRIEAIDVPQGDKTDLLADIAVDAAGRLVMLGNINPGQLLYDQYANVDYTRAFQSMGVLIRLTAGGARDTTFATNGLATLLPQSTSCYIEFCDYDEPAALLTLPDNRILVSGRFVPTGNLSLTPPSLMTLRTVGSNGVTSSLQQFNQWPRSEGGSMVRQADGKFLVAGQVRTSFNLTDLDFALTRFFAP